MNTAIILAAGNASRFKNKIPKQFKEFEGKLLIDFSINTFSKNSNINKIILVVHKNYFDVIKKKYNNLTVVKGGKTRQESSYIGLKNCPKDTKNVLIHDAARPFVSDRIISDSLNELRNNVAVCPALPCTDTIAMSNDKLSIKKILKRKVLFKLQTPQSFNYKILFNCHKKNIKQVTDDISIMMNFGYVCKLIKGSNRNLKVTYDKDFKLLKILK